MEELAAGRSRVGGGLGSDHHLLMTKVRLKIVKVRKGESGRVRFEVSKWKDLEVRNPFKLALNNILEDRSAATDGGGVGALSR